MKRERDQDECLKDHKCIKCDAIINLKRVVSCCIRCKTTFVVCYTCGFGNFCNVCDAIRTAEIEVQKEKARAIMQKTQEEQDLEERQHIAENLQKDHLFFSFQDFFDDDSKPYEITTTKGDKVVVYQTCAEVNINIDGYHAVDCDHHVRMDDTLEMSDEISSIELDLSNSAIYKLEYFFNLKSELERWLQMDSGLLNDTTSLIEKYEYEADGIANGVFHGSHEVYIYHCNTFPKAVDVERDRKMYMQVDKIKTTSFTNWLSRSRTKQSKPSRPLTGLFLSRFLTGTDINVIKVRLRYSRDSNKLNVEFVDPSVEYADFDLANWIKKDSALSLALCLERTGEVDAFLYSLKKS